MGRGVRPYNTVPATDMSDSSFVSQSTFFWRSLREVPSDVQLASHKLLLRAGLAQPLASGLWTLLPLGFRVVQRVEQIIREEMVSIGAQEMSMPVLTPADTWKSSGRWESLEPVALRVKDHSGREYMLAVTHEEIATQHAKEIITSYRQLPALVYHIQTKERDEPRPRGGLIRAREFVMKDSYSFDADVSGLEIVYQKHIEAYTRIFERLGLQTVIVESAGGAMGGAVAHEFQALSDAGEDTLFFCDGCDYRANAETARSKTSEVATEVKAGQACLKCSGILSTRRGIEVGNIFQLGTTYSEKLRATFTDKQGALRPLIMGSYGIGVTRSLSAIIEQNHDAQGLRWPDAVAPFDVHVLPLRSGTTLEYARASAAALAGVGLEVLLDDRDLSTGAKLAEADLLGMPIRVVISESAAAAGEVEVKRRTSDTPQRISQSQLASWAISQLQ